MEEEAKQHLLQILRAEGHGAKLEEHGLFIYSDYPFVGASPDGVLTFDCSCCSGRRVLIEVKCPTKVENSFARNSLQPLPHYYTQMQVSMGEMKIATCIFFVFAAEDTWRTTEVFFDPQYFSECIEAVRSIYTEYIFDGIRTA